MSDLECTLEISRSEKNSGCYRVDFFAYRGATKALATEELPLDPLMMATIECLSYWVAKCEFRQSDLKLLGKHLFQLLFTGKICTAFQNSYGQFLLAKEEAASKHDACPLFRVVLKFHANAEELAAHPWEFLFYEHEAKAGCFLGGEETQLVLTRYVGGRTFEIREDGKELKVLTAYCYPENLDPLDKAQDIISKIKVLAGSGSIKVESLDNPTAEQIKAKLEAFAPHVFHFIGHGKDGSLAVMATQQEIDDRQLDRPPATEGPKHESKLLSEGQFTWLFENHKPRLVFLQACEGGRSAGPDSWSAAKEIVRAFVPAVIAMQFSIDVGDALHFATKFYELVFKGVPIDDAVVQGRAVLGTNIRGKEGKAWNDRRFGTPVIYLQASDAVLFRPDPGSGEKLDWLPCPWPGCMARIRSDYSCCDKCGSDVEHCGNSNCPEFIRSGANACGKCKWKRGAQAIEPAGAAAAVASEGVAVPTTSGSKGSGNRDFRFNQT